MLAASTRSHTIEASKYDLQATGRYDAQAVELMPSYLLARYKAKLTEDLRKVPMIRAETTVTDVTGNQTIRNKAAVTDPRSCAD